MHRFPGLAIARAGTGQDGEFQLGLDRSSSNNLNGTITDGVTGLVLDNPL